MNFTVYITFGNVRHKMFEDNFASCLQFCTEQRWVWRDENDFEWELMII